MSDDGGAEVCDLLDDSADEGVRGSGAGTTGGAGGGPTAAAALAALDAELQHVEASISALLARQAALTARRDALAHAAAADARAPRADWGGAFPWDARVAALLAAPFGLAAFRPLQRPVINATLTGRDVLCLLPSGGGKSLVYQLPALAAPAGALTLVVSPLLALISDQVAALRALGVRAAALTSLADRDEAAAVLKSLDDAVACPRLLYCTPERIVSAKRLLAKLEKLYRAGRLARIAVDECHCCSTYGNDFRPDYKKLGVLKRQFPDAPVLALTATATAAVARDVKAILGIEHAEVFRASVDRPNLFYEVVPAPAGGALAEDIASWVLATYPAGGSGLVYVLTRRDAEAMAAALSAAGVPCAPYHADMPPEERRAAHEGWAAGRLRAVAATIAFGMGVNKTDVRWVVHAAPSKSLENYYQESGRAGRDGAPARCRLYHSLADAMRQASIVCMDPGWEARLLSVLAYCAPPAAAAPCRRAALAAHFGEPPPRCAAGCDACAARAAGGAGAPRADATAAAAAAARALRDWPAAEKRATPTQLWEALRRASPPARALGRAGFEAAVQAMLVSGALRIDLGFTAYSTNAYLKLGAGSAAAALLAGTARVLVAAPEGAAPAAAAGRGGGEEGAEVEELSGDGDFERPPPRKRRA